MASNTIRAIGRATQGVRLIDIEGDDRAVSIARLEEQDDEAKVGEEKIDVVEFDAPKTDEEIPEE
jgi:DNA gyrase/topoisomerase IV subunit A